jgi:tetratricopeptide (TPR) repeat protein
MLSLAGFLRIRDAIDEAETWYRRAAETGFSSAMVSLAGFLHDRGAMDESETWYRRAAETGDRHAMALLAQFLDVRGAMDESETWYRRAAETGDSYAMTSLAEILNIRGAMDESETWYRRAAETGHVPAMASLAQILHERGRTEDAAAMYLQAAKKAHYSSMDDFAPFVSAWINALRARQRFDLAEALSAERMRQANAQEYAGGWGSDWSTVATTAVITAAGVPFLQAIMAKAGEDGYSAVRSAIQGLSRRRQRRPAEDDRTNNVILHVPTNVPDDALRRLLSMDLAALRRASNARTIEVSWDDTRQEWKVVTHH